MLTPESIRQQEALKDLTDDQITAIATLSRNDEESVMGTRIGTLHGDYDKDILESSGVAKAAGEKSYAYLKRVMSNLKKRVTDKESVIADLQAKIKDPEFKADPKTIQELADAKGQIDTLKVQIDTLEAGKTEEVTKLQNELHSTRITQLKHEATRDLKIKKGFTPAVAAIVIDSAVSSILADKTPDFSGRTVTFKDKEGQILRNPTNKAEPYNLTELLKETPAVMEILDQGTNGAGTRIDEGGNTPPVSLDSLKTAKTQSEAGDIISEHLHTSGIDALSTEADELRKKLMQDYKITDLPIQ